MKIKVFGLLIPLICASFSIDTPDNAVIDIRSVPTGEGIISGTWGSDSSVMVFKGVPYAAPPVGSLRWKPPISHLKWEGIRKCNVFSASAMQSKPVPFAMWTKEFMAPETPLSEDCLYLNIWTTAKYAGEKRPVIVWIHGGAFVSGSGSVPLYDGEEMAKKGVVFITINYRLGVFGFLALPQLSKESQYGVSGNYGILDQIAALKWVKQNIAAFGGDPDRVTIAGQSAGAFSVNALMVSPLAKGLFQRAIAESGAMFGRDLLIGSDLGHAEKDGQSLMQTLKIRTLEELRSLPAEDLLKAGGRFSVNIDNYVIPDADKTFAASEQNDVPLLTGWNADDDVSFSTPKNAAEFRADVQKQYDTLTNEFLSDFPAATDEEAAQSQKLLARLTFGWQNYCWARLQSMHGKNKSYLYYFSHVPPGLPDYGAFHSAEFGYALNTLRLWNKPFEPWDYRLSYIMLTYWVNFAANGDPNGNKLPYWPAFDNNTKIAIAFGDAVKIVPLPFEKQLEFLDKARLRH